MRWISCSVDYACRTRFEAENENDNSNIGRKATKTYKQNSMCNGYYIVYGLNDNIKSGYYESPPDYNNVDCFVDELIHLGKKIGFLF